MEKYSRAVGVRLLDLPHHLDSVYTYYVPDSEEKTVTRGDFVLVPFGAGNRKQSAIVVVSEHEEEAERFLQNTALPRAFAEAPKPPVT